MSQQKNTTTEERNALASLRNDKSITILQADKGNATVLLDTDDYVKKAMDLLSHPPFRKLKRDPTTRNEKRVNDCIKRLQDRGAIEQTTAKTLRVPGNGTRPSLFYGSVKIHKADNPLRPIVSTVGSATYAVSKLVSRILSPYAREAPSYIDNSSDFIAKLKDITIDDDEVMVSFDVKSLFTSVPTKGATAL